MLFCKGAFVTKSLCGARVMEAEVLAAVRASGMNDVGGAQAVVLDTNASFNVIGSGHAVEGSSPVDARGRPERWAGEL